MADISLTLYSLSSVMTLPLGERIGNRSLRWVVVLVQHDAFSSSPFLSLSLSLVRFFSFSPFIKAHWKFAVYRGGEREDEGKNLNTHELSFYTHIVKHEDRVSEFQLWKKLS